MTESALPKVPDYERPVEVGPPPRGNPNPTHSECYVVSTWIWAEWNRIEHDTKNIPWWQINRRRMARKKRRAFGVALSVMHDYVYPTRG